MTSGGGVDEEWRRSGGRVEDEWRTSGGRVEDEWRMSGGRVDILECFGCFSCLYFTM